MKSEKLFELFISNPTELNPIDAEDQTVNEALQTIYTYNRNSSVYMKWDKYILELNLAAQIADIYWDILNMLTAIMDGRVNEFDVYWGSNSFMAKWHFVEEENNLIIIKPDWTSIVASSKTIHELKKSNDSIIVEKDFFIKEWITLLEIIEKDLLKVGYSFEKLENFSKANNIIKRYYRSIH